MSLSSEFQDFVDEVAARNDIVDVISGYIPLKRIGNRFQALCPLHNDRKTPSFSVSPDKQLFHCFGCGAGGTVIHFIMAKENLDFMDALRLLADRAHLQMPDTKTPSERIKQAEIHEKKQLLYKINSEAAKFFYHCLIVKENNHALQYLKDRHISNATIKSFGLGYALPDWTKLLEHLKGLGYNENDILDAGLIVKRENGSFYDKFRDRIMFPIIDIRGNILGFGGRIIADKENAPKYLNSPETPVFKKGENLFAMNTSKNDKSGQLLLMEGYMDVISLHQHGFKNAVASLGTAFTAEQARLIKKYAGKVILCYDNDDAGKKATIRAGEILQNSGIKAKVLTVNDGKDPDEYINLRGTDSFQMLVDNAQSLTEYKIHDIEKEYNFEVDEQKLEFISRVSNIFADISNVVEQEVYIKKVARELDISADAIMAEVKNVKRRKIQAEVRRENKSQRQLFEERTGGRQDLDKMKVFNAEKLLLNLLCESEVFNIVKDEISPSDFSTELHREIASVLYEAHLKGKKVNPSAILSQFGNNVGRVAGILSDDKYVEDKKTAVLMPLEIIKQSLRKEQEKELVKKGDLETLQKMINNLKKEKVKKRGDE